MFHVNAFMKGFNSLHPIYIYIYICVCTKQMYMTYVSEIYETHPRYQFRLDCHIIPRLLSFCWKTRFHFENRKLEN